MANIPLIGELLAVLAALFYAFGSVAVTKNARENPEGGNAVLLSIAMTAVLSGGLWLILGSPWPGAPSGPWSGVAYFCLAGLLATVMGRLFFFRGVELAGAIETSLIRRLIPVFAATLAVIFLGEAITPPVALAFAFVFAGVAIMVTTSRQKPGVDRRAAAHRDKVAGRGLAVASAASYGGAYVSRKFGMMSLPDPLLGTFIGAVTGLVWFCAAAPFNAGYRDQVLRLLRRPTFWQVMAACALSFGQIAQFIALKFTSVTAVAIIASIEMFFSAWLAAFVVKTEPWPGIGFVVASLMAMAGVAVLAITGG